MIKIIIRALFGQISYGTFPGVKKILIFASFGDLRSPRANIGTFLSLEDTTYLSKKALITTGGVWLIQSLLSASFSFELIGFLN